MTPEQLAEIEKKANLAYCICDPMRGVVCATHDDLHTSDVPALVAEVKRLTAERDSLKGLLSGSQAELRDAVAAWGRAERERDEARAAIDRVRALRGRCEQGARDNGDYYNNRTGEPAKYELGKAAVYDHVATELREILAAVDGSGT